MMIANDDGGRDALAILGAMILGALMGGLAALLLAPKSGEELRGQIGDAANRAKERAEDLSGQMAGRYDELKSTMDEHIRQHTKGAVEATEQLAEDVEAQVKGS
jgi:gas vesicle protein